MRLASITLEEMTEALNRGWGARDARVAMLRQEEGAGVEIRVPGAAIGHELDAGGAAPREAAPLQVARVVEPSSPSADASRGGMR